MHPLERWPARIALSAFLIFCSLVMRAGVARPVTTSGSLPPGATVIALPLSGGASIAGLAPDPLANSMGLSFDTLTAAAMPSRNVALVGSLFGAIWRSDDGALHWKRVVASSGGPVDRFASFANGVVLSTGGNGSLIRSTNWGKTWAAVRFPNIPLRGMDHVWDGPFVAGDDAFMVAIKFGPETADPLDQRTEFMILQSADFGATWKKIADPPRVPLNDDPHMFFPTKNTFVATFEKSGGSCKAMAVFVSNDRGKTWHQRRSLLTPRARLYIARIVGNGKGSWFAAGGTCEGVGPKTVTDQALRSDDMGHSWQPLSLPARNTGIWPYDITFQDAANGAIAGEDGSAVLALTEDAGKTWSYVAFPMFREFRAVACGTPTLCIVIPFQLEVIRFQTGGR